MLFLDHSNHIENESALEILNRKTTTPSCFFLSKTTAMLNNFTKN